MSKSATATDAAESSTTTLIDASALIALLGAEPAAGEVQEMLRSCAAMTTPSPPRRSTDSSGAMASRSSAHDR